MTTTSEDARNYVAALLARIRAAHKIPAGKFSGRRHAATSEVFNALDEALRTRKTTHGPEDAMTRVLDETLTAADACGDLPGWSPWDFFEHVARTGSIQGTPQ